VNDQPASCDACGAVFTSSEVSMRVLRLSPGDPAEQPSRRGSPRGCSRWSRTGARQVPGRAGRTRRAASAAAAAAPMATTSRSPDGTPARCARRARPALGWRAQRQRADAVGASPTTSCARSSIRSSTPSWGTEKLHWRNHAAIVRCGRCTSTPTSMASRARGRPG
jgi:hypothetical protein